MNQLVTTGIVLARTDYGEADRILTVLTPDYGKLHVLARGVRKIKSKLAGGIELFSVSDITFMRGRGELGTVVSTRLIRHYGHIVQDITRVQLGYELIKLLNKATEDESEAEYFHLLDAGFAALNDTTASPELIRGWFQAQLLQLAGHQPNLSTEPDGNKLDAERSYNFSLDDMAFVSNPGGAYGAADIKMLRLLFAGNEPSKLTKVQGIQKLAAKLEPLIRLMYQQHMRV